APTRKAVDAGEKPFAAVQPVLGNVGGFRFQHQLGNVDVGRTFDGAHLAIDAQVGHGAHFVGGNLVDGRLAVVISGSQQLTKEIRLGPWRGGFRLGGAEDRAHALPRSFSPAVTATVAVERFDAQFERLPV